jgi:hypothetical protein
LKLILTFSVPLSVVMMSKILTENLFTVRFGSKGLDASSTILQLNLYYALFPIIYTSILSGLIVLSVASNTGSENSIKCWFVFEAAVTLKVGGIISRQG